MDKALAIEVAALARHRDVAQLTARGDSEVQRFYAGAAVFLTGGSGFIGKQLIEKLLRSCEIKKIFMLFRSKKQKSVHERLAEFGKDPVFENLLKTQPYFMEKIFPVEGDVTDVGLGISDEDWSAITKEVDIIYHVAATINFTEPLKVAILTNVRGTREALKLGRDCTKLRAFVHVSTAFSHATKSKVGKTVKEKFYECPIPPQTAIELAEHLDPKILDNITPQLTEDWPNTYAFTKAIAEEAVRTMAGDMPVCIVRPAIVAAASAEPSPGWVDTSAVFGATGIILGLYMGIIHVTLVNEDVNSEVVPVDYVNNAIILAGHETAARQVRGDTDIKIYTISGVRNMLKCGDWHKLLRSLNDVLATDKALWYIYYLTSTANKLFFWILTWTLHYIPGYIADLILFVMGKKPMAVKIYSKVYKLNSLLAYFLSNSWQLSDSNLMELFESRSPADRAIYQCDMSAIDWKEYVSIWYIGIRKYIIKDGLTRSKEGLKKQQWLRLAHYTFVAVYAYVIWNLIYLVYSIFNYLFV